SSRYAREAASLSRPDVDPELLLACFLGQLLYDCPDDAGGVYSGLRGHSLGRNMLGMNYVVGADGGIQRNAAGGLAHAAGDALNGAPLNGSGRQHHPYAQPDAPPAIRNADDYTLVNYTYFARDNFLRDPERLGWRADLSSPRGPYAGGFNAPYTYP